jgi:hypothetical protein
MIRKSETRAPVIWYNLWRLHRLCNSDSLVWEKLLLWNQRDSETEETIGHWESSNDGERGRVVMVTTISFSCSQILSVAAVSFEKTLIWDTHNRFNSKTSDSHQVWSNSSLTRIILPLKHFNKRKKKCKLKSFIWFFVQWIGLFFTLGSILVFFLSIEVVVVCPGRTNNLPFLGFPRRSALDI